MGGYSFPEVLFAVVVLGIGFIMIAAIFPVAISQSKATMDETTAAALVRDAVNMLSQAVRDNSAALLINQPMPATGTNPSGQPAVATPTWPGQVGPFNTNAGWLTIRGGLISRDNPRFAFVPLYRRSGNPTIPPANQPPSQPPPAENAQLYIILVQCRALQRTGGLPGTMGGQAVTVPARTELAFDKYDVGLDLISANQPINNPNNLYPHQVQIQLTYNAVGPHLLTVNSTRTVGGANENLPDAIAEGAYVVLADTNLAGRGRIYRIGVVHDGSPTTNVPGPGGGNIPYPVQWELQPGSDMRDATENLTVNTNAFVVGRERLPDGSFTGPAQDVGFYTTIISATK